MESSQQFIFEYCELYIASIFITELNLLMVNFFELLLLIIWNGSDYSEIHIIIQNSFVILLQRHNLVHKWQSSQRLPLALKKCSFSLFQTELGLITKQPAYHNIHNMVHLVTTTYSLGTTVIVFVVESIVNNCIPYFKT